MGDIGSPLCSTPSKYWGDSNSGPLVHCQRHYGWVTPLGTSSYQNIFLCVASDFKNWIDFHSLSQASCLFVLFLVLTNFLFEDRRSFWKSDVQFSQRILLFNFFSFVIVFFLGGGNRILLTYFRHLGLNHWWVDLISIAAYKLSSAPNICLVLPCISNALVDNTGICIKYYGL